MNGSNTGAPSLVNTDAIPSGWTTTLPSQNLYQYMWITTAEKTSAGALVGTWSSPVRITGIQGAAGAQGSTGPAISFYGTWNASNIYIGSSTIVSVVLYNNVYYIARYDIGGNFTSSTSPDTDTSHWNSFGASFSSIATGLLLAQEAYIENLVVSKLATNSNPYHFLLSILNSSLGVFRNRADASNIGNAIIALGKDISEMQASGQSKPALIVRDLQWQGDYDASKIYYKDDRVYYSGYGTYMFMHEWLETETPTAGFLPTNLTYWRQLSTSNLGGGSYSEIGSDGVFTNGLGVDAIPGSYGILSNICLAGLLQHRNGDSNGISAAVMGVDQTSDTDGLSKSYGGYFNRLYIQSELDNILVTSDSAHLTLDKSGYHTIHYYGSSDKAINLPAVTYRDMGLKFIFRKMNAGNINIYSDSGHSIINQNGDSVNSVVVEYNRRVMVIWDGSYWVMNFMN